MLGRKFQDKGTLTSPARLSFVLKVPVTPVRYLRLSIIHSVSCDQIVPMACFVNILFVQINTFVTMNLQGDSRWVLSFILH